jgi:hypothetical protein
LACRARVSTKESSSCCNTAYNNFFIEHINVIERKGKNGMVRTKKNVFNAVNVIRNFIINLSGNIAGAALLTNVL